MFFYLFNDLKKVQLHRELHRDKLLSLGFPIILNNK